MAQLPKRHYLLVLLILVMLLTGCELRRDDAELSDPGPVSDIPPTLAPLGAEVEAVAETEPIETMINVQPTSAAVEVIPAESQAGDNEVEVVAAEQTEFSGVVTVSGDGVEEASSVTSDNPEIIAPQAESAVAEEPAVQEAIIVDATSTEDLPIGGPVAANPPASETSGDYTVTTPTYNGDTHLVQQGDTLFSLAVRYDTSVNALIIANGLSSDVIYAGQELIISSADSDYVTPTYPQQPSSGPSQHMVSSGDTLFSIALRYNSSVEAIAGANGIGYPYFIQVGQTLTIPAYDDYVTAPPAHVYEQPTYQEYSTQPDNYVVTPGDTGTHTVAPGETLYSIAQYYGTTSEAVATANGLYNPNQIYVGQVLYLP